MMYGQHPAPPNYVMLAPQPYYPPPYPYRRSGCGFGGFCRCLCCVICFLFMLSALALLLLYMLFKPKMPEYKLEDFAVKKLDMDPNNFNANTELQLTIRAENPNSRVSFLYGRNSLVSVSFSDTELCNGKLPAFRQGYNNVTMVRINLSGSASLGNKVAEKFKESQKNGNILLVAKIKAPISVSFGDIKLRMFIFHVCVQMTVDSLSPDKKPNILPSNTISFPDLNATCVITSNDTPTPSSADDYSAWCCSHRQRHPVTA
ncbi:hypothetical protein Cgig2_018913 [Carnegiea gigantea]|uniref:Late embryogenesis abundant protein LEA-2 subgroup domain-containing protein n=1 Tax=Carnegiea gigantea TaxID=171969 RepID=A0A9Q1QD00_9CARY|nr:hypothetical protein Cgig2_018913 [Carnegiea gigantea]